MRDIIIFSSIDWNDNWQVHQELSLFLKRKGNRVLFVENTGSRRMTGSDYKRVISRISNWFNSISGFRLSNNSITIFSPLFFPFPFSKFFLKINKYLLLSSLSKWIKVNNFYNPIIISFLPTPLVQESIKRLNPVLKIFYYADNMSKSSILTKKLEIWENKILKDSDLVVCTSNNLKENSKKFNNSTMILPAGVNFRKFEISSNQYSKENMGNFLSEYKKPIIGYIGAISQVFDIDLVVHLASSFKDATIILVGPIYVDITRLKKIKNIIIVGPKNYEEIIKYYYFIDVGIIPYLVNDYTNSVYPTKLNEFLAAGKPVVCTDCLELNVFAKKHDNIISVSKNHIDFVEKIKKELANSSDNLIKIRKEVAEKNNWDSKFDELNTVIEQKILEKKLDFVDTISIFKKQIDTFKKRSLTLVFLFLFTIISFYYTPLIDLVGSPLVVNKNELIKKNNFKADAIAVMSGHADVTYKSLEYKKRTFEAIKLYKKNIAKKIILSSGQYSTFSEVEIIYALLIFHKVKPDDILILESYPKSTHENILLVNDIALKNNFNSMILLTNPFHSLRSTLSWKKINSTIKVISVNKIDIKFIHLDLEYKLKRIKFILHEYAAIIHNYINGRI